MNLHRDITEFGLISKKNVTEPITPHKISIVAFIAEYMMIRAQPAQGINVSDTNTRPEMRPAYIKDFSILILHLIQSPDLKFLELYSLLKSDKYKILPVHINQFMKKLQEISAGGISCFMDLNDFFLKKFDKINLANEFNIHRLSVIGFYIRRFFLAIEKHSFDELTNLHEQFKAYLELDQDKYAWTDESPIDLSKKSSKLVNLEEHFDHFSFSQRMDGLPRSQEHVPCSRKQAELFIATQAALLNTNEVAALSPPKLQECIRNLLKNNSGFSEAHYLSYLNCLRVKEFPGALDSLHHAFDRSTIVGDNKLITEEKMDSYRYASLNLAILYAQFGYKEEALMALKWAISKAQNANDNVCLQHALTWMYKLTSTNKELLLERAILKSSELNMLYNMSLGFQSYTQFAAFHGGKPKHIFEIILKSDLINCQHSIIDLLSNSHSQKAALWYFYGKYELCLLWSQLLLHLKTDHLTRGPISYNGEGICQAVCNVVHMLTLQGEYDKAFSVLNHTRERFSNEPLSHIWMFAENSLFFTQAYHNKLWQKVETAAKQMAAIDQWESKLHLAQMFLAKGDYDTSFLHVNVVLNYMSKNLNVKNRIALQIRAMILLAELKYMNLIESNISAEVIIILNEALVLAEEYHLTYYAALINLHMAHVQLWMQMPSHAVQLNDKSLVTILAHGGLYDRARSMLLYVKCMVAKINSNDSEIDHNKSILRCTRLLYEVKEQFEKVQAYSRVLDVLYLQAKLFDYAGSIEERNTCAAEFKSCKDKYPSAIETNCLFTCL